MHCKFFLFLYDYRNISAFKIKSHQACIAQELHVMQAAVAIGKNMYFPTGWQRLLRIAGCPAWNHLQRMCRTKKQCCLVVSTLPRCPAVFHVSMQIIANYWLSSCKTCHKNVLQVKGISLTSSAPDRVLNSATALSYHNWAFMTTICIYSRMLRRVIRWIAKSLFWT